MDTEALTNLYFGKDDAESDMAPGGLLRQSFLETKAYQQAKSGKKRLIIGRKGSGKSAIAMRLVLLKERHELAVCLIHPDEISADELRQFDLQGVPSEQAKAFFWRYVVTVQVAKYVVSHAKDIHKGKQPAEVTMLRKFLQSNGETEEPSFREKFYQIVHRLKTSISLEAFGVKFSTSLDLEAASEGLRADRALEIIESRVRAAVSALNCASSHDPLMIIIDQLENIWSNDQASDSIIIGLLLAIKRLTSEPAVGGIPHVQCTVFLRTDIYDLLQFDESDKFRGDEWRIDWNSERLLDLVLARARASVDMRLTHDQLWSELFPSLVGGTASQSYIVERTLMRPREIIQLCNLCRDTAEKNGHTVIIETDVIEASTQYSNWKLQDLASEWRVNFPFLSDLFVLFQNGGFLISRRAIAERLATVAGPFKRRYPRFAGAFNVDSILDILYAIGFLGIVRAGNTTFSYQINDRVQQSDNHFVLHHAFREALRSAEGLTVPAYKAGLAFAELAKGGTRTQFQSVPRTRGTSGHRLLVEVHRLFLRVHRTLADTSLPAEILSDIKNSLDRMETDIDLASQDREEDYLPYMIVQEASEYFDNLGKHLQSDPIVADFRGRVLASTVRDVAQELIKLAEGSTGAPYL